MWSSRAAAAAGAAAANTAPVAAMSLRVRPRYRCGDCCLTFLTFFAGFSTPPFAALALVGDLSAFLGAMVNDIEFQKE